MLLEEWNGIMCMDNQKTSTITIYILSKHPLALQMLEDLLVCVPRHEIRLLVSPKFSLEQDVGERVLLVDGVSVHAWPEYICKCRSFVQWIILLQPPHLRLLSEELQALMLGVSGVVYMTASMKKELLEAITSVLQGNFWISPLALAEYMKKANLSLRKTSPIDLTLREEQILYLLNKGYANRKIASALDISERTVKFHISNILHKRRVRSRKELILSECSEPEATNDVSGSLDQEVA